MLKEIWLKHYNDANDPRNQNFGPGGYDPWECTTDAVGESPRWGMFGVVTVYDSPCEFNFISVQVGPKGHLSRNDAVREWTVMAHNSLPIPADLMYENETLGPWSDDMSITQSVSNAHWTCGWFTTSASLFSAFQEVKQVFDIELMLSCDLPLQELGDDENQDVRDSGNLNMEYHEFFGCSEEELSSIESPGNQ